MIVMRLYGKMGPSSGIVYIRSKFNSSFWVVDFDTDNPDDLTKVKLKEQIR